MKITLKTYKIIKWGVVAILAGSLGVIIGMTVETPPLAYFISFVGGGIIGVSVPKLFDKYFLK